MKPNSFIYIKFLFISLSKKVSIYLAFGCYIVFLMVSIYLFPYLFNTSLFNLFTYKTLIAILVMILVIAASYFTICLFSDNLESGTDLLIVSKPIEKKNMVLSKFFVMLIVNVALSISTLLVTPFVKYTYGNRLSDIWQNIIMSVFVATLLIGFIWSTITSILVTFFKKVNVFLIVIGSEIILLVLLILFSLFNKTPTAYLVKKQKFKLNEISLVGNKKENYETKHFLYTTYNNQPITKNTKIDYEPIKYYYDVELSNLIHDTYQNGLSKSNIGVLRAFNFQNQFINFYRLYSQKDLNQYSFNGYFQKMKKHPNDFTAFNVRFSKDRISKIANDVWTINLLKNDYFLNFKSKINLTFGNKKFVFNTKEIAKTIFSKNNDKFTFDTYKSSRNGIKQINQTFNNLILYGLNFVNYLNENHIHLSDYFNQMFKYTILHKINKTSVQELCEKIVKIQWYLLNFFKENVNLIPKFSELISDILEYNCLSKSIETQAKVNGKNVINLSFESPIKLMNKNQLETITEMTMTNEYNNLELVLPWTFISLCLLVWSIKLHINKDIF